MNVMLFHSFHQRLTYTFRYMCDVRTLFASCFSFLFFLFFFFLFLLFMIRMFGSCSNEGWKSTNLDRQSTIVFQWSYNNNWYEWPYNFGLKWHPNQHESKQNVCSVYFGFMLIKSSTTFQPVARLLSHIQLIRIFHVVCVGFQYIDIK